MDVPTDLNNTLKLLEKYELNTLSTKLNRGVERECLRVSKEGFISQMGHPKGLGSALTHPYITTDYGESLLEFVTPVETTPKALLKKLEEIHRFTYQNLGDEILWPYCMPCPISSEDQINIAQYGSSNIGRMKTIYRQGLKRRYGGLMQIISGVHYNFSMPSYFWPFYQKVKNDQNSLRNFIDKSYLNLIRNFYRYHWVIPYLFGSSPAVCGSFLKGKNHKLTQWQGTGSLYGKYATSLRMSDFGYQNNNQNSINICYNSLEKFVEALTEALHTKDPVFSKWGIKSNGEYIQLNDGILQIENEYYAPIRPKRITLQGERPSQALLNRGIEYVEVRCLDVNPFTPIGMNEEQILFLDMFLFYCLIKESPSCTDLEFSNCRENFKKVVNEGRDPNLKLNQGQSIDLALKNLFNELEPIAHFFDNGSCDSQYTRVLGDLSQTIGHPEKTYSGILLDNIFRSEKGVMKFFLNLGLKYRDQLMAIPFSKERNKFFDELTNLSVLKQKEIENNDILSLDDYIKSYFK